MIRDIHTIRKGVKSSQKVGGPAVLVSEEGRGETGEDQKDTEHGKAGVELGVEGDLGAWQSEREQG